MKGLFVLVLSVALQGDVLAGERPVVFEVLDPVLPGQTALLFGADIGPNAQVQGIRLKDDPILEPPVTAVPPPRAGGDMQILSTMQMTDLSAKVVVPEKWKPGVFALRVKNREGLSSWMFANRPEIWWQASGAGGLANPGGEIRIFGKNFGPESRAWLMDGDGVSVELYVRSADNFELVTVAPSNLGAGRYRLWVHNGSGGMAGFGEPFSLTVAASKPWPDAIFNVRNFGAKGDGETDDTAAIQNALDKAGAKRGGIVFVPNGTYIVRRKLCMPRKTVLRGEARKTVWLKVPGDKPALDSVIAGDGEFGVENLSIVSQSALRLITSPDFPDAYEKQWAQWKSEERGTGHIKLRNLRLEHLFFAKRISPSDRRRKLSQGPTTIAIKGYDCTIEDCFILSPGVPFQLADATRARIANNTIRTGRGGLWLLYNAVDTVFEGNDISGADLEGNYGKFQGSAWHVVFRGNRCHDAYGLEREGLSFDSPYFAAWAGHATVAGRDLVLDEAIGGSWPPDAKYPRPLAAVVVGGRGVGQLVPVTQITASGVCLERPFGVPPDQFSVIAISALKSRVLILDNSFSDASVAMQLFAQSDHFIISGNRSERTGGSYAKAFGSEGPKGKPRISYAFFNEWMGNSFGEGLVYDQGPWTLGFVGYSSFTDGAVYESLTPAIGNRFVNNRLLGKVMMGAHSSSDAQSAKVPIPSGRDAIFEQNIVTNCSIGISIDTDQAFTLLRRNIYENVPREVVDDGYSTRCISTLQN